MDDGRMGHEETRAGRTRDQKRAAAWWAAAWWGVRLAAPYAPSYNGHPLGQVHQVCSSPLAGLAQAFSATVAQDCSQVAEIYDLLNLVTVAAVACTLRLLWLLYPAHRPEQEKLSEG
jgi:hypothetical protein